jgi:hypothetical protein
MVRQGAQHAEERLGCGMADRILTAEAAQTIQAEADRDRELLTWVVMEAEDSAEVIAAGRASFSLDWRPAHIKQAEQPLAGEADTLATTAGVLLAR